MLLRERGSSACAAAACQAGADQRIAGHLPVPLWGLPGGAQEGPVPWTPPGTLKRVSRHRKRENIHQGSCRDSVHLHLLFLPAVAKVESPQARTLSPNITSVLKKLFYFCPYSIKLPFLSYLPAVKACTNSPLLPSLALWPSCTHPSLHLPVLLPPGAHSLLLLYLHKPLPASHLLWQCHSPAPWASLQCLSSQHFHGLSTLGTQERNQGHQGWHSWLGTDSATENRRVGEEKAGVRFGNKTSGISSSHRSCCWRGLCRPPTLTSRAAMSRQNPMDHGQLLHSPTERNCKAGARHAHGHTEVFPTCFESGNVFSSITCSTSLFC